MRFQTFEMTGYLSHKAKGLPHLTVMVYDRLADRVLALYGSEDQRKLLPMRHGGAIGLRLPLPAAKRMCRRKGREHVARLRAEYGD